MGEVGERNLPAWSGMFQLPRLKYWVRLKKSPYGGITRHVQYVPNGALVSFLIIFHFPPLLDRYLWAMCSA